MELADAAALAAASIAAGGMNALAGGGSLLTFPTLLLLGDSAIVANATSTVALVPGAAASLAGYRAEVATHRGWLGALLWPSLVGGAIGSGLLLATPERLFASLVPWLVLFATALFAARGRWRRPMGAAGSAPAIADPPTGRRLVATVAQLLCAIYGGYFGAGIGILMLAILAYLGLSDIHAMNGLKNFFGICINGVAAAIFVAQGAVDWPAAAVMAAGAVAGGYGGARFGRRIGRRLAERAVVAIGLALAALLLARQLGLLDLGGE